MNQILGAILLYLISSCQIHTLANEREDSIQLDWKKETGPSFWEAKVNSFDVPSGAVVEVKGPKNGLIRVTDYQPTSIRGTLISSNPIYVINPKGVVVGPGVTMNDNDNVYLCSYPLDVEDQKRLIESQERLIKRKNLYLSIIAAFHCSRWFSAEIKEGMIVKVCPKEGVTNVGEVVTKETNGLTIFMGSYEGTTGWAMIYPRTLGYSYEEIRKLEIIALTNKDYGNVSSNCGFQIRPSSHPLKIPLIIRHYQENKSSVDRETEKRKNEMKLAWKMAYDFVPGPGVERPSVSVHCYSLPIDVSYDKKFMHDYLWLGDIRVGGLSEIKKEQGSFGRNGATIFPNNPQPPTNHQQNP